MCQVNQKRKTFAKMLRKFDNRVKLLRKLLQRILRIFHQHKLFSERPPYSLWFGRWLFKMKSFKMTRRNKQYRMLRQRPNLAIKWTSSHLTNAKPLSQHTQVKVTIRPVEILTMAGTFLYATTKYFVLGNSPDLVHFSRNCKVSELVS